VLVVVAVMVVAVMVVAVIVFGLLATASGRLRAGSPVHLREVRLRFL
jgi:hypothetical protein